MPTPRFTCDEFRTLSTGAVVCIVHDAKLHRRQSVILHERGVLAWDSPYPPKRTQKRVASALWDYRQGYVSGNATVAV